MATNSPVPAWPNSLNLHVCETSLGEPVQVLVFCWEEHPYISKESGKPKCGMHGTNEAGLASLLQHSISLCNASLRIGPVLNAAISNRRLSNKEATIQDFHEYSNSYCKPVPLST